jgi:hypothetical protein
MRLDEIRGEITDWINVTRDNGTVKGTREHGYDIS